MGNSDGQRLIILVEGFYPHLGGGSLEQWHLAQEAVDEGFDVTVYTPKMDDTPKKETVNGVNIRRPFSGPNDPDDLTNPMAMFRRIVFNALLLPYLLLQLRKSTVDIVYCPSHLLHPVAKIVATLKSAPVVQFIGFSPSLRNNAEFDILLFLEKINFRLFMGDFVFTRNSSIANQVKKYNSESVVTTVDGIVNEDDILDAANDFHPESLLSEFELPEDTTLLCWVGRVVDIKNPEGAIQIINEMPDQYHLVFIGDGPRSGRVQDLAEELDNSDRIHFIGRVPHHKTLQLMGMSHGLVLTSHTEAYPTVAFEALCLDTPVFSTPVGVLPEISDPNLYLEDICSLHHVIDRYYTSNSPNSLNVRDERLEKYGIKQFSNNVIRALYTL
ncbi:glycosyltransferase family 4 protein [Halomarina salina]|uniref:Glycosyltransferase family 4 protein n=1 Tax=Halomarina salina TaxID=1872699 RepID=A0ABD5RSU9_9EURY|nr:glycosyltransferase family 4 protein [Halomarina salina]